MTRTNHQLTKKSVVTRRRLKSPVAFFQQRRLLLECLENRTLLTAVVSVSPPANSHAAPTSTDITATLDQAIDPGTVTIATFAVHSSQRSPESSPGAMIATSDSTISFDPGADFFPGELVQVSVTDQILSTSAAPATPHVWQFRNGVVSGSGQFTDSGQFLGSRFSLGVSLGDLDADGDLDAFVVNYNRGNHAYLNNGGIFTETQQSLGDGNTNTVTLGDLDGDGDLDAFLAAGVLGPAPNSIWFNDGNGSFTQSGQSIGNTQTLTVALGDLDGDGDLDAVTGNVGANRVYLNEGGVLTDSGQSLGSGDYGSVEVALGDIDGDGDLDAFVANGINMAVTDGPPNQVWLNDGGIFSDSGQALGNHNSWGVALGDLDQDGDLDAFVANRFGHADRVWINNAGQFADSGQSLGTGSGAGVQLGDLDGDGDLDAFVTSASSNQVWQNTGGLFTDTGQYLRNFGGLQGALGDVDGDGDLDALIANFDGGNTVWLDPHVNTSARLDLAPANSSQPEGNSGSTALTFSVIRSGNVTEPTSVQYSVVGSDENPTDAADFGGTLPSGTVNFTAGETELLITLNVVGDELVEPDETFTITISNPVPGETEIGTAAAIGTILNDDLPLPEVTLSVDNASIPEAAGVATFTATLSAATVLPVTVDLAISGSATPTADYTALGTQIVITAGATSGSITVTAVNDEDDEADETVVIDIDSVSGGNEVGTQQAVTTITDDDAPQGFTVTALTATASGFVAEFSADLNAAALNLFDTQNLALGDADVTLVGAASGPVRGSLVVDASLRRVTFIKSGGPLAADSYTVTLRSGADGFHDAGGQLLDGNGDGTAGDDYSGSFDVASPAAGTITVSIPDFVRGPGQGVNLPADETTGIPITISDGDNVRAADVRIGYDPALLEITGATAPAGGSVIVNTTTTPGVAILVFFSSSALPAGSSTFINLQATVPADADYGSQQVLNLHSVTVGDGNDNEFPVVVDDALHFSTYFADVSGNGRVNASDAAQVARFAALIDGGFAASLNTDPIVVGDISGNGRINAADASRVAQFAALIEVPEIPPIPAGVAASGVVHLGPGLPDLGFGARQVARAISEDIGVQSGDAPLLPPERPDPYQAVDKVMASMVMLDEDPRLILDLEDAMAELLSAELLAD